MYSILVLVTVVAASVYASSGKPCDKGWRYFPVTRSCYKLIEDELPWSAGEFKCLFQGAHHTSIENSAENQFVHELSKHAETWIGAAFFGSAMVYVNADQKPYGRYTNWENGRTPPLNKARRCIKIDKKGKWVQSCCKKRNLTVCKKSAAYSWKSTNDPYEFRRLRFRRN